MTGKRSEERTLGRKRRPSTRKSQSSKRDVLDAKVDGTLETQREQLDHESSDPIKLNFAHLYKNGAKYLIESAQTPNDRTVWATPADLLSAVLEYFTWVDANPLKATRHNVSKDGDHTTYIENVARAMTIGAMMAFHGRTSGLWRQLRAQGKYAPICAWAEEVIRAQKFELAAGNFLNANIIIRDLGLSEKQEHTSPDGSMTPQTTLDLTKMTDKAKEELLDAVIARQDEMSAKEGQRPGA